jgi:glycosyltransferase involved in cell wall biosynthesis
MKICHATTFWPNRYGHTHYTDALIRGMQQHHPVRQILAAEGPSAPRDDESVLCVPCFQRDDDFAEPIAQVVKANGADVVLIQYTNDLFGEDERFPRLLERLKADGVKTVVNMHSVYPPTWRLPYPPERTVGAFDRALGRYASCINVHSRRMRADLIEHGVEPDLITVIPHGSRLRAPLDRADSLRALGVPTDRRVVLFFGFIWLGKGLSFLLDVFGQVARRVPDSVLYIGGYTRKRVFYTRAYMGFLRAKTHVLGFGSRTWYSGAYVPDDEVDKLYSASSLVALPYCQDYSSVSGVVHQAAGYGRLMLCSRIAKFDEVEESISSELVVDYGDKRGWVEAMTRLLTDEAHADAMRARVAAFAAKTSWEEVGRRHLALYEGLLAGEAPASVQQKHFPRENL